MKLFTFQTLLICFPSILCDKYCAHIDFIPGEIFRTDQKYGQTLKMDYKTSKDDSYCYISFYSKNMPENLDVRTIYDCSAHFEKGKVKAGTLTSVPETLKKYRCYYQRNWIICICNINYCNSPQYWPLMLARFSHESSDTLRKDPAIARDKKQIENIVKKENLEVTVEDIKTTSNDNLRCLVWLSDTLAQEEDDPKFYFYNYVTLLHRAPALADALTTPPVERLENHHKTNIRSKIYFTEKEPFEDGTHETDPDYRTFKFEQEADKKNKKDSWRAALIGTVMFVIALVVTFVALCAVCRSLQDHSSFTRSDDIRAYRRFERCFKPPQIPQEFVRKRGNKKKTSDPEAGASQKWYV